MKQITPTKKNKNPVPPPPQHQTIGSKMQPNKNKLHTKNPRLLLSDNKPFQNKRYNASEICLKVYYNEII
jgi:hypothetical protein